LKDSKHDASPCRRLEAGSFDSHLTEVSFDYFRRKIEMTWDHQPMMEH